MVKTKHLAQMADAAPAGRDRVVDLLRAASIAVVVLGHWLMAVVTWQDGRFDAGNALDRSGSLWILTWVLQVMPLFFLVGGFSNARAWQSVVRRGGTYGDYLQTRLSRLLAPTAVFAAFACASFVALRLAGVGGEAFEAAAAVAGKPLWFLAVYVGVVAVAPAMLALHERHGVRVLIALAAGAAACDALRIASGVSLASAPNYALVWLFAHQLGFLYADGRLQRLPRRTLVAAAAASLAMLAALTGPGPFATNMVGARSDGISNNTPPSVCLIALSVWLTSLTMLLRPRLERWVAGTRQWRAVVAAKPRS